MTASSAVGGGGLDRDLKFSFSAGQKLPEQPPSACQDARRCYMKSSTDAEVQFVTPSTRRPLLTEYCDDPTFAPAAMSLTRIAIMVSPLEDGGGCGSLLGFP